MLSPVSIVLNITYERKLENYTASKLNGTKMDRRKLKATGKMEKNTVFLLGGTKMDRRT